MGTAMYHFKAIFSHPLSNKERKDIRDFLRQTSMAEDWWQAHRNVKPAEFWPEFEKLFPLSYDYLKFQSLAGGDCDNDLAGCLECGSKDEIKGNLHFKATTVKFVAEVWHLASWDSLEQYFKKHFGAVSFNWMSDEYMDCSDMLDCMDYKTIIESILEKDKEDLPAFLGVHPLLDAMIATKLKG